MSKKKDLEWIAYVQKVRIEEHNKAIDKLYEILLEYVDIGYLNCKLETLNERVQSLKIKE